ncbi:MAG TPA: hypothetical protein VFU86_00630 [Terriglobales bacterium]|nr:hypothetical protein [Terriglobales bacterium]
MGSSLGKSVLFAVGLCLLTGTVVGQDHTDAVPLLTGTAGFVTNFDGGHADVQPVVAPVLLVPIGEKWLIEGRGEFEGDFQNKTDGSFGGPVGSELQYLQLDYIANKYLTFSTGRYLTPFGIYNERLYPIFIRNFQQEPLIFGLESGSSTGGMVRGGFEVAKGVDLNYATYFSALTTTNKLDSDRMAGARVGFYFPRYRFEIGASGQHLLQEDRTNSYGLHLAWQPNAVPLDIRGEYAYGSKGKGYWLESAYKLSAIPFASSLTRHTQFVARMQQFFIGKDMSENDEYELPDVQTRQVDWGLNYYFRDDVRLQASYGRAFSSEGNRNVWSIGATYRFAMPLWPGGSR